MASLFIKTNKQININSRIKTSSSSSCTPPPPSSMKWGFATTAAIVRSLQKDLFYREQLKHELKLILIDHFPVGWVLRIEDDWLPLAVDCFYYAVLTGRGHRTLGESYSHLLPVDVQSRTHLLKDKIKRIAWVLMTILVPFAIKKRGNRNREIEGLMEVLEPINRILLYGMGKFPTILNQSLSIRYIFYPRKPPIVDGDALLYKGLAAALGLITLTKLNDLLSRPRHGQMTPIPAATTAKAMKEGDTKFKCPVCLDPLAGASFASMICGHVYCWHCISRWLGDATEQQTSSCPVCRVACGPTDLVPLANLK